MENHCHNYILYYINKKFDTIHSLFHIF